MNGSEKELDPEVVALVQEIVDVPGSALFRVPTRSSRGRFALREPAISSGEASSNFERHLLEVCRDDLADAFLHACHLRLTAGSPEESLLHPMGDALRQGRTARAERLVHSRCAREVDKGAIVSLSVALRTGATKGSTLAKLSLRLRPSDAGRIALALSFAEEGDPQLAVQALTDVLGHHPSHVSAAHAHHNLGFVLVRQGKLPDAASHYMIASRSQPGATVYETCTFVTSLLMGNEEGAMRAALELQSADDSEIDLFIRMLASSMRRGMASPTDRGKALFRRLRERLPSQSRRIADVFWK